MNTEKNCMALCGMLHEAYNELAPARESSAFWYAECEKLKARVTELETQLKDKERELAEVWK